MHSRAALARGFRDLGVEPGDTVMVHASVRSVGPVAGGADEIHLALKDALTEDGTILMYAGCPRYYDEVGRGNLTPAEEQEVLEKLPAFDPLTARCARDHGILTEFFRTWPGTKASNHVTRFLAWGRHADRLLEDPPWDYTFGYGGCLDRFTRMTGKILLLGSDHDAVTYLHYAEHIIDIAGKRVAQFQVPVRDENGRRVWRRMEEYDTAEPIRSDWPEDVFARIVNAHLKETRNEGGQVGDARSFLIDARALLERSLRWMALK